MHFDLPPWLLLPWLFVTGAVVGSFLNVCIYRIPRHEKLWDQLRGLTWPPSSCPACQSRIEIRDNIPILGWLLLRGRCRSCRHRISPRYPLIEALNGLLFVLLYICEVPLEPHGRIGDSGLSTELWRLAIGGSVDAAMSIGQQQWLLHARYLYHLVLVEALVVATFIDFDLQIIPDGSTVPAMIVGVLGGLASGCFFLVPVWFQDPSLVRQLSLVSPDWLQFVLLPGVRVPAWIAGWPHLHGLAVSLAGLAIGGGTIWIVRIVGHAVLRKEAMGFGDVVLMAMIGSFLGWQPVLVVFFIAPVCALVVVTVSFLFRRTREIPYGPYLSLATIIVLFGWPVVWPRAERVFDTGPLLPVMAVVGVVLLVASLLLVQGVKRLLGIVDANPEPVWSSADQLTHFMGENVDPRQGRWRTGESSEWPGFQAGRGSLHEQRWRRESHGGSATWFRRNG